MEKNRKYQSVRSVRSGIEGILLCAVTVDRGLRLAKVRLTNWPARSSAADSLGELRGRSRSCAPLQMLRREAAGKRVRLESWIGSGAASGPATDGPLPRCA